MLRKVYIYTHKLNYLREHNNNTKAQLNAVGSPRPSFFPNGILHEYIGCATVFYQRWFTYATRENAKDRHVYKYIHYISAQFTFGPKPSRPSFQTLQLVAKHV